MTWEMVIIQESNPCSDERSTLASRIDAMITHQQAHWRLLRDNLRSRSRAEMKTIKLRLVKLSGKCCAFTASSFSIMRVTFFSFMSAEKVGFS